MTDVAALIFDPSGKTDDELWALVREACRARTDTWRAYERLHAWASATAAIYAGREGALCIAVERERHIREEGFTPEHDKITHQNGELAKAAAAYAMEPEPMFREERFIHASASHITSAVTFRNVWPWPLIWWKPKDRIRNLVRAGALIAAEIDRLLALEAT